MDVVVKEKPARIVLAYILISLGCLIYSLAWTQIFIPNGAVSGGITGLCSVIQYGTGFPIAASYAIFNAVLLLLGFLVLGRAFGIRTIYALALITLLFEFLPMLDLPTITLKEGILNPIIASIMEAIGIAMMMSKGGSSGGTDIIAMIVNKFWPISIGTVYIFLDIAIIASVMLVPGKTIDDMVYGYIAVITFSTALDYIMMGENSSVQLLVFSDKHSEIAEYVNKVMNRGVTALKAVGWYTRKDRNVLLILVRKREMNEVIRCIKELDPRAFVGVSKVSTVYGEGFDQIKAVPALRKSKKKDNEFKA